MPIHSIRSLNAFGQRFLVACPQCDGRAILEGDAGASKRDATLNCAECDFARQWRDGSVELESQWHWFDNAGVGMGHPVPTGSHGALVHLWVGNKPEAAEQTKALKVRLWLQTPCGEENLWFLGEEHLVFTSDYLNGITENRSTPLAAETYREKTQWIESWAEEEEEVDRATVLQSIEVLRRKLGTPL